MGSGKRYGTQQDARTEARPGGTAPKRTRHIPRPTVAPVESTPGTTNGLGMRRARRKTLTEARPLGLLRKTAGVCGAGALWETSPNGMVKKSQRVCGAICICELAPRPARRTPLARDPRKARVVVPRISDGGLAGSCGLPRRHSLVVDGARPSTISGRPDARKLCSISPPRAHSTQPA